MAMLNQDLDYNLVSDNVKGAFSGRPEKVRLMPGTQLYRLITANNNHNTPAPWWYTKKTFDDLVRRTGVFNLPLADVARSPLAVTTQWNPKMDWLSIIQIQQPVFCLIGTIQYQPLNENDRSILLMGGLEQVFLPGLASRSNPFDGTYARTVYFGKADNVTPNL